MKMKLLSLILPFLFLQAAAQIPKPTIHSLTGTGSVGSDGLAYRPNVYNTPDGGFIVKYAIYTPTVAGNSPLDSLCSLTTGGRYIFTKYNANATMVEWTECYPFNSNPDSVHQYIWIFPSGERIYFGVYLNTLSGGFYMTKYDASGNFLWTKNHSKGASVNI